MKINQKKLFRFILLIILSVLIAIVIFTNIRTPKSGNFDEFVSDFSKFSIAVENAYNKKSESYSLKNERRRKAQIYYEVASGIDGGEKGLTNPVGSVASLGTILSGDLEGTEYYLVTPSNKVLEWNQQNIFYEDEEKYYITDKGEAFFLPGYLVKIAGEQRWYITDTKYYVGDKKIVGIPADEEDENRKYEISKTEQSRLDSEGVSVLTAEQIEIIGNTNLKNSNIKMVLKGANDTRVVPVPIGFEYVTGTEQTGLVIESNGNQFVWVPVPDASALYTQAATSEEALALKGDTGVTTMRWGNATNTYLDKITSLSHREPDLVLTYDTNVNSLKRAGVSSATEFATEMVSEFNNMIDSVIKYKGFYVGRYELGYDVGVVCRAGVPSLTSAENSSYDMKNNPYYGSNYGWHGLYRACKEFLVEGVVGSGMIWGCQWDAMCTFLGDLAENTSNIYADGKHRLTGEYNDEIKNINDTRTGVGDWTLIASYTDNRVYCGGYYYKALSATSVNAVNANNASDYLGTRPQLYIK